jgi:hypothetical protein
VTLSFQWDRKKAELNDRKHGVTFNEAKSVFDDPLLLILSDEAHSEAEPRLIAIGVSSKLRILMVVHVERGDNMIRIISARKATSDERNFYEQSNS